MYLYGIEIGRLTTFKHCKSFKLYLYGIEIALLCLLAAPVASCSNCTFMELKLGKTLYVDGWKLFKLYLYGIEIKQVKKDAAMSRVFKLYLYGIEIGIRRKRQRCMEVQIVPLWNWNTLAVKRFLCERSVQIVPLWNWNTRIRQANMKNRNCSNCTFMELKSGCWFRLFRWVWEFKLYLYGIEIITIKIHILTEIRFKLYLYGIEISAIQVCPGFHQVQIVPLWNWNRSSASL